MKYFNCLTPKNSSDFTYSFKDLNEVPSNELKPGYSSDALTCFSSQVYGKKQSFFGTASTFTKLESPDGDTDDQIFDGEPTSRQSFDLFNDRGGPRLSIYRADDPMPSDRNQIDSLSVYKAPKETIITRSLPQFEPGKKSLFALKSMDLIKSQTTEQRIPTTNTIVSARRSVSPMNRRNKKSQTVVKRHGPHKLKV